MKDQTKYHQEIIKEVQARRFENRKKFDASLEPSIRKKILEANSKITNPSAKANDILGL